MSWRQEPLQVDTFPLTNQSKVDFKPLQKRWLDSRGWTCACEMEALKAWNVTWSRNARSWNGAGPWVVVALWWPCLLFSFFHHLISGSSSCLWTVRGVYCETESGAVWWGRSGAWEDVLDLKGVRNLEQLSFKKVVTVFSLKIVCKRSNRPNWPSLYLNEEWEGNLAPK